MDIIKLNEVFVIYNSVEISFDELFLNKIDANNRQRELFDLSYIKFRIHYKDLTTKEYTEFHKSIFSNYYIVLTLEDALIKMKEYWSECPNCQDESF